MSKHRDGLVQLHMAVLLFGLTGLFGKWLTVSPMMIVLGRTAFGALALAIILAIRPAFRSPTSLGLIGWLALSGILLAFHWVSFFQSIRVSSVAVGLLTVATFPLFVTLLEPVVFREPLRVIDALTLVLVLAGLVCIVPQFDFSNHVTQGVCWGTIAGLSFAVLSLINRRLVKAHSSIVVAAGQNIFAALALLALLPTFVQPVTGRNWILLFMLGVFCTALAHSLFIQSLTQVRAQLAGVVTGLESVYGTALAFLVLHERPAIRTVIGGVLILAAVAVGTACRHNQQPQPAL